MALSDTYFDFSEALRSETIAYIESSVLDSTDNDKKRANQLSDLLAAESSLLSGLPLSDNQASKDFIEQYNLNLDNLKL